MKKLVFSIQIKAPKVHVWNILWDNATYPVWTSVFAEGSQVETDWQEDQKKLKLISSKVFPSGVIALHYERTI
ncbi:MAG: hypothetical protein ACKVT2_21035 [Saprospiraceae bacterium]